MNRHSNFQVHSFSKIWVRSKPFNGMKTGMGSSCLRHARGPHVMTLLSFTLLLLRVSRTCMWMTHIKWICILRFLLTSRSQNPHGIHKVGNFQRLGLRLHHPNKIFTEIIKRLIFNRFSKMTIGLGTKKSLKLFVYGPYMQKQLLTKPCRIAI